MIKAEDDPRSLPLKFTLMKTYSFRLDSPLVPVLYVRFPFNSTFTLNATSTSPNLNTHYIDIIRIIDPEHREPFISIGRLLSLIKPNPISPITAIEILKELHQSTLMNTSSNHHHPSFKPIYSLLLNGLAPFPDLWVNLKLARLFSIRFGLLKVNDDDEGNEKESGLLASLLDWNTKSIWSIVTLSSVHQPIRTGELISNWRIPEEVLPLRDYSLTSLQKIDFHQIEIKPETIGEEEYLRLPITIPKEESINSTKFKTFPDTLLSEICLLSSDLTNPSIENLNQTQTQFRISKSLEALGELVLGHYLDLDEIDSVSFKDQIDSLGILLCSVWRNQVISHPSVDPLIDSNSSDLDSNSSSNSSSNSTDSSLLEGKQIDEKLKLPIERIEKRLESIESQLEEVLSFRKVNDSRFSRNRFRFDLEFFEIQSKWIWFGLIGLGYILGRIQVDG